LAYLLFTDESGTDHSHSPYEVLAGVAVEDSRTWNLITAIQEAEIKYFGRRITIDAAELKGKNVLKRKTFRLASQLSAIPDNERLMLASAVLIEGQKAKAAGREADVTRPQLTALGQARLAFVSKVLELCAQHQVRTFAAIVDRDAPRPKGDFLRKDYACLFERFFYFLEEQPPNQHGLVVFDELERSRSRLLLDQMGRYFQTTAVGRMRSSRILPEPMFVRSDLTSLIQVADLIAYVIAWGVRIPGRMTRPYRQELRPFADAVLALRHKAVRQEDSGPFYVWSFAVIDDLRPAAEKS
jgi:hypothetical protein